MRTLKILKANNKSLIGRLVTVNEKTGLAKMGRTEYKITFGFGTVETNDFFELFKLKEGNQNSGTLIHQFDIIK